MFPAQVQTGIAHAHGSSVRELLARGTAPVFMPEPPHELRCLALDSILCVTPDVRELAEQHICVAWSVAQRQVGVDLQYLFLQLYLLDLVLASTRNRVDQARSIGSKRGETLRDASSVRDTRAEDDMQQRSCSWESLVSTTQFQRDGQESARAQFSAQSRGDFTSSNQGFDRTRVQSSTWSYSHSLAQSRIDADAASTSILNSAIEARSSTQTAPMSNRGDINDLGTIDLTPTIVNYQECFDIGPIRLCLGGARVTIPGETIVCTDEDRDNDPCPNEPNEPCKPLSSYGRACRVRYNLSVGLPFGASVSATWETGLSFRQSYVCTCGGTDTQDEEEAFAAARDLNRVHGQTLGASSTQGITSRDVHRLGNSVRTNGRRWDQSSRSSALEQGERRTGKDTSRHQEAETRSSGFSERVSAAESRQDGFNRNRSDSEAKRLSQIFEALSELRDRIWSQIRRVQSGRFATFGSRLDCMDGICTAFGTSVAGMTGLDLVTAGAGRVRMGLSSPCNGSTCLNRPC